jgi:hypothetical protein
VPSLSLVRTLTQKQTKDTHTTLFRNTIICIFLIYMGRATRRRPPSIIIALIMVFRCHLSSHPSDPVLHSHLPNVSRVSRFGKNPQYGFTLNDPRTTLCVNLSQFDHRWQEPQPPLKKYDSMIGFFLVRLVSTRTDRIFVVVHDAMIGFFLVRLVSTRTNQSSISQPLSLPLFSPPSPPSHPLPLLSSHCRRA